MVWKHFYNIIGVILQRLSGPLFRDEGGSRALLILIFCLTDYFTTGFALTILSANMRKSRHSPKKCS